MQESTFFRKKFEKNFGFDFGFAFRIFVVCGWRLFFVCGVGKTFLARWGISGLWAQGELRRSASCFGREASDDLGMFPTGLTQLSQADYIGVSVKGTYKPDYYRC